MCFVCVSNKKFSSCFILNVKPQQAQFREENRRMRELAQLRTRCLNHDLELYSKEKESCFYFRWICIGDVEWRHRKTDIILDEYAFSYEITN